MVFDAEAHPKALAKVGLALVLVLCGVAVFVLGSPYYSVFPTNHNPTFYSALTIVFLLTSFLTLRYDRLREYWPAAYSFFIASFALWFMSTGLASLPASESNPVLFVALDKISQFLHVVPSIVVLTLLAGNNLKSIFLGRGNLKSGLMFGCVSFAAFALIAFFLFRGQLSRIGSSIHWILIFVFANSLMEELWFRGIFLKRLEPLIGIWPSFIVTSAVFGASHVSATYVFPGGGVVFGMVVFILGIVAAYSMHKTDSIIGALLFHAGYDLLVIVPILESV